MSTNIDPASATGLTGQYLEAQNPATQQRVTMAMIWYTQQVALEDPDTPEHEARIQLAAQVSRNPTMWAQPFTLAVCAQGFNSQGEDGVLRDYITQVWNTLAGTMPGPMPRYTPPPSAPPAAPAKTA